METKTPPNIRKEISDLFNKHINFINLCADLHPLGMPNDENEIKTMPKSGPYLPGLEPINKPVKNLGLVGDEDLYPTSPVELELDDESDGFGLDDFGSLNDFGDS